jgi:sugar phosphate isomerase/epimerase
MSNEFLFHDRARLPFMKGSSECLFEASAYVREAAPPMSEIAAGIFIPIVPTKVRMPLTNWLASENSQASGDGVMQLADVLQNGLTRFPRVALDSEMRLTRFHEKPIDHFLRSEIPTHPEVREKVLDLVRQESRVSAAPCWVWLQWDARSAWLWNAEAPGLLSHLLNGAETEPYLKCAVWKTAAGIELWPALETQPGARSQQGTDAGVRRPSPVQTEECGTLSPEQVSTSDVKRNIGLAVLSSYAVGGIKEMLHHWPLGSSHCEFYALMQKDADFLLQDHAFDKKLRRAAWTFDYLFARAQNALYRPWRPRIGYNEWERPPKGAGMRGWLRAARRAWVRRKSLPQFALVKPYLAATERMAAACDRDDLIEQAATRLNNHLAEKHIQLIGLASFIPGLADYRVRHRQEEAEKGVKFLLKLSERLKPDHPELSFVELVSGSLVYGISRIKDPYGLHEYLAWTLDPLQAVYQLATVLRRLAEDATKANVKLILEYEPGPLYVLGNRARLEIFARIVAADREASKAIALNCDVAHWAFLSGFDVVSLSPEVRNLIYHGHLSSHGRGHYGDAPIEDDEADALRHPEEFRPWIELLRRGKGERSGFVTLELEACKHREMIDASVDTLRRRFNLT